MSVDARSQIFALTPTAFRCKTWKERHNLSSRGRRDSDATHQLRIAKRYATGIAMAQRSMHDITAAAGFLAGRSVRGGSSRRALVILIALGLHGHAAAQNASNYTVTATGSTTARTLATWAADTINVRNFGATGDGTTDDSAAVASAINAALGLKNTSAGAQRIVYFPSGSYLLRSTQLPVMTTSIEIKGDGPHQTYIVVDPAYAGDVFAWSEAWEKSSYVSGFSPANDYAGPGARGVTVIGNTTSTNVQTALHFYDRNDFATVSAVDVYFLHGACLSVGDVRSPGAGGQAYLRESWVRGLKCFNSGTPSIPAIQTWSSTTDVSDATNTILLEGLRVFAAAGVGISIRNPPSSTNSRTRLIRFIGGVVEASGADNIDVGNAADLGQVSDISFIGMDSVAVASGYWGMKIDGGASAQTYDVDLLKTSITNGSGGGLDLENVRQVHVSFSDNGVPSTPIQLGAKIGTDIFIEGNGQESQITYSGSTSIAQGQIQNGLLSIYHVRGFPTSGQRVGTVIMQGTASGARAIRLTTDGNSAVAANCVQLTFAQAYFGMLSLIAWDTTSYASFLNESLPVFISDAFGSSSLAVTKGPVSSLAGGTGTSASFSVTADTTNGCPDIRFVPPSGNTDTWTVTGRLDFTSNK